MLSGPIDSKRLCISRLIALAETALTLPFHFIHKTFYRVISARIFLLVRVFEWNSTENSENQPCGLSLRCMIMSPLESFLVVSGSAIDNVSIISWI